MTPADITAFHRRCSEQTWLMGTGLFEAGVPERFEGVLYDGPHEFNAAMQDKAYAWLDRWLKPAQPASTSEKR